MRLWQRVASARTAGRAGSPFVARGSRARGAGRRRGGRLGRVRGRPRGGPQRRRRARPRLQGRAGRGGFASMANVAAPTVEQILNSQFGLPPTTDKVLLTTTVTFDGFS